MAHRFLPRAPLALAGALCVGAALFAQAIPSRPAPVVLDVAVVDGDGETVSGLGPQDFQVKEDGHPVVLTSVKAVSSAGLADRENGRTVLLVLDDVGVPPDKTVNLQYIARAFLARTTPFDTVSVMRFNDRTHEIARDQAAALETLAAFRAAVIPFQDRATHQDALETVARLARLVEGTEGRKVIVCIGSPVVFDVGEPGDGSYSMIWRQWVDAMTATARANTSVYLIDPNGSASGFHVQQAGLITHTGGAAFMNSNAFDRAVDRVWREAGHYYLLGYQPADGKPRPLHRIEVRVMRKGLQVHARRLRGD
jgi:VWFA-related protein